MSKLQEYGEFIRSVRSSLGYWKSYSLLQFTSSLTRIMKIDKVSGRKLASQLGISTTQVSKVLRGNENITIETMAKFAKALDAVVYVHVAKKGVRVQWLEMEREVGGTATPAAEQEPIRQSTPLAPVVDFLPYLSNRSSAEPIFIRDKEMGPALVDQS